MYSLCYVPSDWVNEYYHEVITKLVDDGEEKDEEWEDYQEEINAFGSYYRTTWIEKRGGRGALFKPELWNQYATVLEGGLETNNMLESFNRTWNSLSGYSPNVFAIQEVFVKQDAEARRAYLLNAVGLDMATNSGRKQRSKDSRQRVKFVVEAFRIMPKADYIQTLAHDQQKASE